MVTKFVERLGILRNLKNNPWVVSFLANGLLGLLGLFTSVIVSRSLGPDGRGMLVQATIWTNLVLIAGGIVNTQSTVYFWSRAKVEGSSSQTIGVCFAMAGVLIVILTPVCFVVNWFTLGMVGKESFGLANLYTLSIPMSLISAAIVPTFLADQEYTKFWAVRLVTPLCYLVGLVLLYGHLTPFLVVWLTVGSMAVQVAVAGWLFVRQHSVTLSWDRTLLRQYAGYGMVVNVSNITSQLNVQADQMLMSLLLPASVLGYYVVAFSWSSILLMVGSAVSSVMLAEGANKSEESIKDRLEHLFSSFRLVVAVVCLIGLLVLILTPVGILVLYGQSFAPSVVPAMILTLAATVLNAVRTFGEMLRGLGHPKLVAWAEGGGFVINLALLYFLLPTWHGTGAALASLSAYGLVFALLCLLVRLEFGVSVAQAVIPGTQDFLKLWHAGRQFLGLILGVSAR